MKEIHILPGEEFKYQGSFFKIRRVIDLKTVLAENTNNGNLLNIPIKDLAPIETEAIGQIVIPRTIELSDKEWDDAHKKFEIIKPLLEAKGNGEMVIARAKEFGINKATVYRWIEKYTLTESITSLAESRGKSLKGKKKIDSEVEEILKKGIEEIYLTKQRKKVTKVIDYVIKKCKDLGLAGPHENTIRKRIKELNEFEILKKRYSAKASREAYDPSYGKFTNAPHPLSVVEIDHTKVDLILVDEVNRLPIGRPWITLATDIYSRMIVGYYLSFDAPSFLSVGLCIAHSILPKEKWLLSLGVEGDWPCWGKMKIVHSDNGKEFKSSAMKRSCAEYGIELNYRPPGKPYWGGHVERLLGTLSQEIHTLPGTTFSNTKERKDYKSEKKAAITIKEFEQWLVTYIVNVYHKQLHTGIEMSPIDKYEQGIIGSNGHPGVGLQPKIMDESKVKLDFMPYMERTVQDYGVMVDRIHYYSDVLKKWVNKTDITSGKARLKKKFIFKYDPRDISCIYFFDPELKDYFQIPYRDLSKPSISIWEYRAAKNKLKADGIGNIDEDKIFAAFERMKQIEEEAVSKTKRTKIARSRGRKSNTDRIQLAPKNLPAVQEYNQIDLANIQPFD